ncbi:tRNA (guanine-N(7)-)-methyltransferase [Cryptococcus gattii NT-10]|nr:tRNA (guanine-N(7)-)-methyltransferase [Cryptococcus gattii NT-10]
MSKRTREELEMEAGPSTASPGASASPAPVPPAGEVQLLKVPQKRFYRQRAHANVFIDHELEYPKRPELMDWSTHYPAYFSQPNEDGSINPGEKKVEWADVGCGFGGLLMALAPLFPEKLMLGMEIRTSVTKYVTDRIAATRQAQSLLPADSVDTKPGGYQNVSVIKANSMKHMPNFFAKGQVRPFLWRMGLYPRLRCSICHLGWRER